MSVTAPTKYVCGEATAAEPPACVVRLMPANARPWHTIEPGVEARSSESANGILALLSLRATLDELGEPSLDVSAARLYQLVRTRLARQSASHPLRFWNFIPALLAPDAAHLNRYMRFNIGRHEVLSRWSGDATAADRALRVAATGVGNATDHRLVVHCLSASRPGCAIENPCQIAAYRYSERFGPRPPYFARATLTDAIRHDDHPALLVSGTASVLGEQSVHRDQLDAQLDETLRNLARVIQTGSGEAVSPEAALHQLRSLRVYVRRRADVPRVLDRLRRACPAVVETEWQVTDLCRDDLLVEVEGLAAIPPLLTREGRIASPASALVTQP